MANGKLAEGSRHLVLNNFCDAWSALQRGWIGIFHVAETWMERSKQRRDLASLNDAILEDLGLPRADVEAECRKHFWRP